MSDMGELQQMADMQKAAQVNVAEPSPPKETLGPTLKEDIRWVREDAIRSAIDIRKASKTFVQNGDVVTQIIEDAARIMNWVQGN